MCDAFHPVTTQTLGHVVELVVAAIGEQAVDALGVAGFLELGDGRGLFDGELMLVHAGASGLRCADRREGLDLVRETLAALATAVWDRPRSSMAAMPAARWPSVRASRWSLETICWPMRVALRALSVRSPGGG